MKNFISPVNHIESYLSAATVDHVIKKTKELGLGYVSITDSGYLSTVLKVHTSAQKAGIKAICGVEIYFKDDECDIIKNTDSEKAKYFQLVIHAIDQKAFQKLVKMSSQKERSKISLHGNNYPLFNWSDLIELSKENVTVTTSSVNCMISKHLFVGRPDLSLKYFRKLNELFGENLYLSLIPSKYDRYWSNMVELNVEGKIVQIPANDRVESNGGRFVKASDLTRSFHSILEAVYINKVKYKVNKKISSAKLIADFVNIPEGDLHMKANKLMVSLSKNFGNKLLLSSYSHYVDRGDKIIQSMMLEEKRYDSDLHMASTEDVKEYLEFMGFSESDIEGLIQNNEDWANRFKDFSFKYDYALPDPGGDPKEMVMAIINEKGRMKWDDPVWVERLRHEFEVFEDNGVVNLLPYLFPIYDVLNHYQENNLVTGPSRGSAAGSLMMFLMGITQVDPIKYNLPFSRFLSIDRIQNGNFPDVDVDLPSRELLVGKDGSSGYLYGQYGDKAAQISTRTLLRLKSSIKDVNRFTNSGVVESYIEDLTKALPAAPQGIDDLSFVFGMTDDEGNHVDGIIDTNEDLKNYTLQKPEEWEAVQKALGVSRQFSRHACSFIIANKPISDIVPIFEVAGVQNVAQYEAKQVEWAKLVKYDFLTVSALKDIGLTINRINDRNKENKKYGTFSHKGSDIFIWDLPHDDGVYDQLGVGDTTTIFQLNTTSMTPFVKAIQPRSIVDMATISALVRPGPLDFVDPETGRNMAEEYIERRFGNSSPKIKLLGELLPETYGIIIYQENLTLIGQKLGKLNVVDAENLRIFMSKKKKKELMGLKPKFMEGAVTVTDEATAEEIWNQMETFARYGFSVIHAVGYAHISYACAFLKHHYPLEWWASVLSNAEDKEIREVFFKHVKDMVAAPDINISREEMVIDYNSNKIRSKLSMISGLGAKVSNEIISQRPYIDIQDFVNKKPCGIGLTRKLVHVGVLDSLFETGLDLEEKMQKLEDADQIRLHNDKVSAGKKVKEVKKGKIDPVYLGLSPKKDFLLKKSVFPNMMMDLYSIMLKESRQKVFAHKKTPTIESNNGKETFYINGDQLQKIDSMDLQSDMYFASPGYVIEAKEFTYSKGSKKALKIIIDSSGYISEKVLWADYQTGELNYPKALAKGAIVNFFYSKKAGKPFTNIMYAIVDSALDK